MYVCIYACMYVYSYRRSDKTISDYIGGESDKQTTDTHKREGAPEKERRG